MGNNTTQTRITLAILMGLIILLVGTAGYSIIEGWDLLDSLYMTLITVATIGYGEIAPLSPLGRIFTIFIIVFGVGNAAFLVGQLTQVMVEGSLRRVMGRRKLEKQIKTIKDHYIICGYGRIGRIIAKEISDHHFPLVIIENSHEIIERVDEDGYLYIMGEATDDDNMIKAGIERARGLISVVSSDADNVYIVLTARALNKDLFIVTRSSHKKSVNKLERAGADKVISPYQIGARSMAQSILRPAVADFIESTVHGQGGLNLAMEGILVTPRSKLQNTTLKDSNIRRELDLMVIAIKMKDGEMVFNPCASNPIQVGDTLIVVGHKDNMARLEKLLGADTMNLYRSTKASDPKSA
ncbi:MAG: potassium channel protein [Deltaproteobacteria bacterium]|nr:potassium channel protein [Deltaproteobacteria bacterium]